MIQPKFGFVFVFLSISHFRFLVFSQSLFFCRCSRPNWWQHGLRGTMVSNMLGAIVIQPKFHICVRFQNFHSHFFGISIFLYLSTPHLYRVERAHLCSQRVTTGSFEGRLGRCVWFSYVSYVLSAMLYGSIMG